MIAAAPGEIRLDGVARRYRLVHQRNRTLKETALRRKRVDASEVWALRGVDLHVKPGEAVGVIGRNGSGKSTLLKLAAGIMPPHGGEVAIGGRVASMLELGAGFHPDFSGRENVFMNGTILGLSDREIEERFEDIVRFSELGEFVEQPVRTYSSGMYMRLAFSVASHVDPDVLLLDEVLAVGDEAFQRKCLGRMFEFRRRGGTLLLVSHDANAIERVCDRAVLLEDGRVVADGATFEVLSAYHRLMTRVHGDVGASVEPAPQASAVDATGASPADAPPATDAGEVDAADVVDGNGTTTVTAVRLVGDDGPRTSFTTDERLAIEIDVRPEIPIDHPEFGVMIYTVDGMLVYATNTALDSIVSEPLHAPTTVSFEIPALRLHQGQCTVSVAVSADGEVCSWVERCVDFTVFAQRPGVGLVDLSGTWSRRAQGAGDTAPAARERGAG